MHTIKTQHNYNKSRNINTYAIKKLNNKINKALMI